MTYDDEIVLHWLAKNVDWPADEDVTEIRLDSDGEVCFNRTSYDFFPENLGGVEQAIGYRNRAHGIITGEKFTKEEFMQAKQQLKSPTVAPRSLACFREVANVIGEDEAEKELQRVLDDDKIHVNLNTTLIGAFTWAKTPQGEDFWHMVHGALLPNECSPSSESSDNNQTIPEPEFGQIFHIGGERVVFVSVNYDGDYIFRDCGDNSYYVMYLTELDEYVDKCLEEQLRERILERWQALEMNPLFRKPEVQINEDALVDFVVMNIREESQ